MKKKILESIPSEENSSEKDNKIEAELLSEYRKCFGKRLRTLGSGGAHTSPEVFDFLRKLLPTANIVDGYGTTEFGGESKLREKK